MRGIVRAYALRACDARVARAGRAHMAPSPRATTRLDDRRSKVESRRSTAAASGRWVVAAGRRGSGAAGPQGGGGGGGGGGSGGVSGLWFAVVFE